MDNLGGVFEAVVSSNNPFDSSQFPIKMGDVYKLQIGEKVISTGYIEVINVQYDALKHTIRVSGRDKVCDLVDCSRVESPTDWNNTTIKDLILTLIKPFELELYIDPSATSVAAKKIAWFSANQGDSVFETLKRLAITNSLMLVAMGDGRLKVTRSGSEAANGRLETGINVLTGSLEQSNKDRFSHYHTKGYGFGTDEKQTKDYIHPEGDAQDTAIKRYRPLMLFSEDVASIFGTTDRAYWESILRAGNSRTFTYTINGWVQPDGSLWENNMLIQLRDTVFGITDKTKINTFLIFTTVFIYDEKGTKMELRLCYPSKYTALDAVGRTKAQGLIGSIMTLFDRSTPVTDFE